MTKRLAFSWLIGTALFTLPQLAVAAQTYNAPAGSADAAPASATPAPGSYGGGFLEFLLTGGHAAAPAISPTDATRPAPSSYRAEAEPDVAQHGIDPIFLRQEVNYEGKERPGTIVIDTSDKFLFLVEKGGHALRYGIGVGRDGFAWSGVKTITRKAEWPDWTPPAEMLKRRPDLPTHMDGGPENPLGARALYLGSSLYRIHGTNEPYTIGTSVSSGCIRMMNDDVMDLYNRVGVGTKVIVM